MLLAQPEPMIQVAEKPLQRYIKIAFFNVGYCICKPGDVDDILEGSQCSISMCEVWMTEQAFEAMPEFES